MSKSSAHVQAAPSRAFHRFVRTSIRPVVVKLSRKLSVTYWPGRRRTISAALLTLLAGFVPSLAAAAPTGANVVSGSAVVSHPSAAVTQVTQGTQNAIINWQSFSIGVGEGVKFVQPNASAVALNRIVGNDPTRIFGSLSANGKVFLVNNAGVYFAPGASVDVGGLVASSMRISDANFLAGKYQFEGAAGAGSVDNYGQLRGAFVVLAAPQVSNAGSISARGGAAALAAGGRVALDIAGDKLVSLNVDAAAANAAVRNSGSINADGGKVFMSARSANAVLDTVINTSGVVRASSIGMRDGQIVIDGGNAGTVAVSGTLAASGAAGTHGGAVSVLGERINLQAGANIDVSGDAGGGKAIVGGDFHGAGAARTASFTQVDKGAVINADAGASGDGGKVAVWSDKHTEFAGSISAAGGVQGGDGGFVETSGKQTLAFRGAVNTRAARGATGTLLLDPTDITISNGASTGATVAGGTFSGTAASSNISVGDLTAAVGSSNVVVDTASGQLGSGNITVSDPVSYSSSNSLTLKASGNISVGAAITNSGAGAINLAGDGTINSGTLASNGGSIAITGAAGGSSKAGSIGGGTITSGGGDVTMRASGSVSTGSIHSGSGTIAVSSDNLLDINGALASSNTGISAIVLNAGAGSMAGNGSGGDIWVNGGSVTVGAGGRATLYTGTIAGSTAIDTVVTPGSGHSRYNSSPTATNFADSLGAGIYAVYREQPVITVAASPATITYGDVTPAFALSVTGLKNGDTEAQALSAAASATLGGAMSTSGHPVAGAHSITAAGAVDQLGYGVTYASAVLTVDKKSVDVTGVTATSKVYDTLASAPLDASAAAFVNGGATASDKKVVTGDVVSLAGATGAYADKHAGTNKTVTVGTLTMGGADGDNYTPTLTSAVTGTITPKDLAVSGVTATDKVYDATTTASISGGAITGGAAAAGDNKFYSGDAVTLDTSAAAGAFADKHAGAGKSVAVTGIALTGADQGDYNLIVAPVTAAVTAKPVTASGVVASDKVYDTTVTASVDASGAVLVSGAASAADNKIYTGDAVSLSVGGAGGTFADKNAGSGKSVALTGMSLTGSDANDYALATTTSASITRKPVEVSGITVVTKVYDSTNVANLDISGAGFTAGAANATDNKVYTGDNVLLNPGVTGAFADKHAGASKVVSVTGMSLGGADGGNYQVVSSSPVTGTITPKDLAVSGVAATDKVYDSTTTASISGGAITGGAAAAGDNKFYTGDAVTLDTSAAAGAFADKHAGAGKSVAVTGLALTGADQGDYNLIVAPVTAAITAKPVAASGVVVSDKVYDTTVTASVDASAAALVSGAASAADNKIYTGDAVTLAVGGAGGTFADKNAGAGKSVALTGIALTGADANDYTLATTASASITPKPIDVSGITVVSKVYDSTNVANLDTSAAAVTGGAVNATDNKYYTGDTLLLNPGMTGAFADKHAGAAKAVSVSGMTFGGADGGNYEAVVATPLSGTITRKDLVVSGIAASDKVYDATPVAAIGGGSIAGGATASGDQKFYTGDAVALDASAAAGAFADKHAGASRAVTVTGLALTGADKDDYNLVVAPVSASVTAKPLAASGVVVLDKVYDSTLNASVDTSIAAVPFGATGAADNKAYTGDNVSLNATGVTGTFTDKNAGAGKSVALAGLSLGGADAGDYTLATTASASITRKPIDVSGMTVTGKVYDSTDLANLDASGAAINSGAANATDNKYYSGDNVVLNPGISATFADKHVGVNKAVTVNGLGLSGTDSGNYQIVIASPLSATIDAKNLLVSGMTAADKTYDSSMVATLSGGAITANASGAADNKYYAGDDVALSLSGASGAFADKHIGSNLNVTVSGAALTGSDAGDYHLIIAPVSASVIRKDLLVTGILASDKVYNATPVAALSLGGAAIASGATTAGDDKMYSGDAVVLSTAGATGAFADRHVAANRDVTVSGVTITGADAGDYNLIIAPVKASISQKNLEVSGITAANRVYDTTATAALNVGAATITGGAAADADNRYYAGDALVLGATGATGAFVDKHIGAGRNVTVSGVTLSGAAAADYRLTIAPVSATVTPKNLLVTGIGAASKTYNASAVAALNVSGAAVASGATNAADNKVYSSDSVVLNASAATGAFPDRHVGTARPVTVSGLALTGADAGDYVFTVAPVSANIVAKDLQVTGIAAASKTYNASAVAALNVIGAAVTGGAATSVDNKFYTGDNVALSSTSATGAFPDKHVGANRNVTVSGLALTGADAGDYHMTIAPVTASVVAKPLQVTGISAANKVYDALPTAALNLGAAVITGGATSAVDNKFYAGDSVNLATSAATGAFPDKTVGIGRNVTVSGLTLTGTDAGDYALAVAPVTASISAAHIVSITGLTSSEKVYDGNQSATFASGGALFNGRLGADNLGVAGGTASFGDRNVGAAKTVTISGMSLTGPDAGNYILDSGAATASAAITRRPSVTFTGSGDWSNAANWDGGALPDLANVAHVVIPDGKTVTFNSSVAALNGAVQLDGIEGGGALSVASGSLKVADALGIGSYAQSGGAVNAASLTATTGFNQSAGKLGVTGNVDASQASGTVTLGSIDAASLALRGGASVVQAKDSALVIGDAITLATGAGDVTLGNKDNDFKKVAVTSANNVVLTNLHGLDVSGTVGGSLRTSSESLNLGPTTVGGDLVASTLGAISQSGALNVGGSTIVDAGTALTLDDKRNSLRGKVRMSTGADATLVTAGGVAIGGDIGGKLVVTAAGPVIQAGDALHVKGTSSVDASAGSVTLGEKDNHFTGVLTVAGSAATVADKGALALGAASIPGNLSVAAEGPVSLGATSVGGAISVAAKGTVTQAGKLVVTGASTIDAKGQAVTLADSANSFGGKLTLGAGSATVNAAGALDVAANVDGGLTLGAPQLKVGSDNPLTLHMNTGAATITATKALSMDGNVSGALSATAGGPVTQGAALTVGGASTIGAAAQTVTLTNAGNDFVGDVAITAGTTQLADKNALSLAASTIGGNLQASAKGDVTQKGALNVTGTTSVDSTGTVALANENNDFGGAASASGASVLLRDKDVLNVGKVAGAHVDLTAGTAMLMVPGGLVDSSDIVMALLKVSQDGAIGSAAAPFTVRDNAKITLGTLTPAVPAYFGGSGMQVSVTNSAARSAYASEVVQFWLGVNKPYNHVIMDIVGQSNVALSKILRDAQKKADSSADVIESGMPIDLTERAAYPHAGALRLKEPLCDGKPCK